MQQCITETQAMNSIIQHCSEGIHQFTNAFVYSFGTYLLQTYHMLGIALSTAEVSSVNKKKYLPPLTLYLKAETEKV